MSELHMNMTAEELEVYKRVKPLALESGRIIIIRDLGAAYYCEIGDTVTLLDKVVAQALENDGVSFIQE